ncbi:Electron transfer flavoprotein small subunit [uncultured Clostridium sp.]|uniref:electron transfer flavoprotein subunit beta/FixA family protein n=1 Tax=uncultured Clostridium sp. TaxID=59620 RepID=UPI000821C1BA|nr:electron transfer flavoprotein subunit beta/FixA family protein [uncultured Clostridium sp.]SCK03082.1 Electron transfer flavoprotein small subunit [uncultured Clostridium sp.]
MNILVCIKQVPGTTKVEVDPITGVLKRDGIDSKMNPYDLYALETGLKIKENNGGSISVLTMGPPQAKEIIKEAYSMGVDNGVLLSDRKFAGADVLATSYTLSQGIKSIGNFDLIICGKQTTDGDTAQVGPEIAEYLNIPHVANVKKIVEVKKDSIELEMDMPDTVEIVEIKLPALITVEKGIFQPRLPSYKKKMDTKNRKIEVRSLNDFKDKNEMNYGLNGSPTQVERIFPPEVNDKREIWSGNSDELILKFEDTLKKLKFI